MKKGFVYNQHPEMLQANSDLVYFVGITGMERDPQFLANWNNANAFKRGIIARPSLASNYTEYDNASKFLELVQELGFSSWNNGNPLILDIWEALGEFRFSFDHVRVYGNYIRDYFKPLVKPLLRINIATWMSYLSGNKTEALRLLNNFELLLVQPGAPTPSILSDYGVPAWWEYQMGKIAYDSSKSWLDSPNAVAPIPVPAEPTLPTEPEQPVQPPAQPITLPKKWRISLLGGLIKGEIEAVE